MSAPRGSTLLAAGVAGVLLGLAWASPRQVPYDMDEFAHYQPLGCLAHPLSREHNLRRESCGAYDLRLPGTSVFLPLRSYLYIGSLPVLPFYPFWRILQDPVAARLQGAFFFVLAGVLVARITGATPLMGIVSGLVLPPYAFSFLVDTGPVGLSVVLLLMAMLLFTSEGDEGAFSRASLGGFCAFLGIFTKPVFGWALPALGLYALVRMRPRKALLGALLAFLLPTLTLAFSVDRSGDRYYELVRLGGVSTGGVSGVSGHFASYLFQGSEILPRSLTLTHFALDALPGIALLLILALGLLPGAGGAGKTRLFVLLALLTLAATLLTGSAFWPHHFALTGAFLQLALAARLSGGAPLEGRVFYAFVALFWAWLLVRIPHATQAPEANEAKDRLLAFLQKEGLPSRVVEVHTGWGTFYLSHLFGPRDEEVLYFRLREWTESGSQLAQVKALAMSQGRPILVITSRSLALTDTPLVHEVLGPPASRYTFDNWEALVYKPQ